MAAQQGFTGVHVPCHATCRSPMPLHGPGALLTWSPTKHFDLFLPCRYPRPAMTVDTAIVAQPSDTHPAQLLLIKRKHDPYQVRHSMTGKARQPLPGGRRAHASSCHHHAKVRWMKQTVQADVFTMSCHVASMAHMIMVSCHARTIKVMPRTYD